MDVDVDAVRGSGGVDDDGVPAAGPCAAGVGGGTAVDDDDEDDDDGGDGGDADTRGDVFLAADGSFFFSAGTETEALGSFVVDFSKFCFVAFSTKLDGTAAGSVTVVGTEGNASVTLGGCRTLMGVELLPWRMRHVVARNHSAMYRNRGVAAVGKKIIGWFQ